MLSILGKILNFRSCFVVALFLCCIQASAQSSAHPWRIANCPGDDCAIYYRGQIRTADVKALLAETSKVEVKWIYVSSVGGSGLPAISLANRVREWGATIVVEDICMSACANYVFPSARKKVINDGAIIIWHGGGQSKAMQSAIEIAEQKAQTALDSGDVSAGQGWLDAIKDAYSLKEEERQLFAQLGVDERVTRVGELIGEPASKNWTISPEDFAKFGILNVSIPSGYANEAYLKNLKAHVPIKVDVLNHGQMASAPKHESRNLNPKP